MSAKTGVQAQRYSTDPWTLDVDMGGIGDLVSAGPRVIKVIGDYTVQQWHEISKAAKTYTPILISRDITALEDDYEHQGYIPSAALAEKYYAEKRSRLLEISTAASPRVWQNVWPNEYDVNPSSIIALNEYFVRLQQLASADNIRLAILALGAEARLYDKWSPLRPSLELAADLGNLVDLHGYFCPHIMDLTFDNNGNVISSVVADQGEEFLFPYRPLIKEMRAVGSKIPKFVLGEYGVGVNYFLNRNFDGYRSSLSNERYALELQYAEAEMQKDPELVGATIFLAAAANREDDMGSNINIGSPGSNKREPDPSVWLRIRPWITALQSSTPIPPPVPTPLPQPVPSTGEAIVSYSGGLNLRQSPSSSACLLQLLPLGTRVQLTGVRSNGYAQITFPLVLTPKDPPITISAWLYDVGGGLTRL
jgi:hypothetical protein